ncbi:DUF1214 domain-containing protein [Desulfogranum marinum]|uniref:DUF1214 domain-containing protein n=1 Tax=Desulfogranum marinum TaxID=453220 RepID=UPI0029C6C613|nr:DUF1214 domain-containing protein [Desulfogranum marinum]
MRTNSMFKRQIMALPVAAVLLLSGVAGLAEEASEVTAFNYVRAESDIQMKGYIESFKCLGKFHHNRKPYDVNNQITVRGNRDTLYSFGVWDLTSPVTITLPETGGRYQSLMVVSQDHSIWSFYGPRTGTLTEEKVGTRYVLLALRTFMDPNDEQDMEKAYQLQDAVIVEQDDIGKLEVPDWSKEEVEQMRNTINVVGATVTDSSKFFGKKEELDPVYWLLGAALGWGGLPAEAATYGNVVPEKNDGKTPHTLTVTDVPVYGFWSVTLYDDMGLMPINEYNAYSFNNVTAKKAKDGSITIHFGGDPKADNFLPIVPGWNYIVRMYQPGPEILKGTWTFPDAEAVE